MTIVNIHVTTTQGKTWNRSIIPDFYLMLFSCYCTIPARDSHFLFLIPTNRLVFPFHANEITQYVVLYGGLLPLCTMFLRLIHIVGGLSNSFHVIVLLFIAFICSKYLTIFRKFIYSLVDGKNIKNSYKSIQKDKWTVIIMKNVKFLWMFFF